MTDFPQGHFPGSPHNLIAQSKMLNPSIAAAKSNTERHRAGERLNREEDLEACLCTQRSLSQEHPSSEVCCDMLFLFSLKESVVAVTKLTSVDHDLVLWEPQSQMPQTGDAAAQVVW